MRRALHKVRSAVVYCKSLQACCAPSGGGGCGELALLSRSSRSKCSARSSWFTSAYWLVDSGPSLSSLARGGLCVHPRRHERAARAQAGGSTHLVGDSGVRWLDSTLRNFQGAVALGDEKSEPRRGAASASATYGWRGAASAKAAGAMFSAAGKTGPTRASCAPGPPRSGEWATPLVFAPYSGRGCGVRRVSGRKTRGPLNPRGVATRAPRRLCAAA